MENKDLNEFESDLFGRDESTSENVVIIGSRRRRSRHHHRSSGHGSGSRSGRSEKRTKREKKSKKKRNPNKTKLITKATVKKYLPVVFVVILIIAIVCIISYYEGSIGSLKKLNAPVAEETVVMEGKFTICPTVLDEVNIISDVALKCVASDRDKSIVDIVNAYKKDKKNTFDKSVPVTFKHEVYNLPEGTQITGYKLVISEMADMSDAIVYNFAKDETIKVDLLKTNTQYYYSVTIEPMGYGYSGSFKTSDTPRILSIDGIGNVRDIGNWKTVDGKRIKQGLLYRGTELDGMVESKYRLTEEGKRVMLDILKIKYDMDLRAATDNPKGIDMLGDGVEHKYYNCAMYNYIFSADAKATMKEIFTDLANPANYPMYLHCTYGLDRTGTVCYLLEALLGVSDEDLIDEYELSTLFHFGADTDAIKSMKLTLDTYEGDTTKEKVVNYLLECGVTMEQMESIREIFLED